jgi:general secretion pathway protein A
MYRKHFALTAFPFDLALPPDELFASATLNEAKVRLKHLLELRAIGLVTGEVGSGKTTVCCKVAAPSIQGFTGSSTCLCRPAT